MKNSADHAEFWTRGKAPRSVSSWAREKGIVAMGGDLSLSRLLAAYRQGIFPWYDEEAPAPLWWSPDPRMVLFPEEFRLSRSLRRVLCHGAHEVRMDTAFAKVITACAKTPRRDQAGSWITGEIRDAYTALHAAGYAHSVETWMDGELAGGLYGVAIGRMFYGESMFSLRRDASKIAFAYLVRHLRAEGFGLIDCQVKTAHLASLGGREIPRLEFNTLLRDLVERENAPGAWPQYPLPWTRPLDGKGASP
jgi:leucyl/phenylalanyl-tRNA--protein transferase